MILLEDRFWSAYACGSRMGVMALLGMLVVVLLMLLHLFQDWLRKRPMATSYLKALNGALSRWSVAALAALVLCGAALVLSLSPSLTHIATDGSVIVETGCHGLTPYTKRILLAEARIDYEYSRRRRGPDTHSLVVAGNGHSVRLGLRRETPYGLLADIAPTAMAEFARTLEAEGRPVPEPLGKLL